MILAVSDTSPNFRILGRDGSNDAYEAIASSSSVNQMVANRASIGSDTSTDANGNVPVLRFHSPENSEKTPLDPCAPAIIVPDEFRLRPENSASALRRKPSFKDKLVKYSKDVGRVQRNMRDELKITLVNFMNSTTAHGIPMVLSTSRWSIKVFWILLSVCSVCCFIYQCQLVFEKFSRKDKIVNVELIFEAAPFPAITVCNLNPFKKHAVRSISEVRETLDNYHQAVMYSKAAHHDEVIERRKRDAQGRLRPSAFRHIQYEPVLSDCECVNGLNKDCVWKGESIPKNMDEACICNFDNLDRSAWPCYNSKTWDEAICPECNDMGFCNRPNSTGIDQLPCMCSQIAGYCLIKPPQLKHVWHFLGKKMPPPGNPFRKEYMDKLRESGYENVTDQVAITTLTKEKLIMQMSSLEDHTRAGLSYGRHELIKMCSFNGKQCNIDADFRLLIDPNFGNCFTFNGDRRVNITSSRAGPNNGLRLMVAVNVSDYLPTTEASGVRIVIHGKTERAFPDTFGYSAPTGAVSSFGISMRQVNRIPLPLGDCVHPGLIFRDYIYQEYSYTPEGCYRSKYQAAIQERCGCADPRFPRLRKRDGSYLFENCDTMDEEQRLCILKASWRWQREADKKNRRQQHHACRHSCREDVFSTTYSAAKWPSSDINVDCEGLGKDDCMRHYSDNAAMLEIYFEQLSYEVLRESESYLIVNLISDIGGQAGLWLGASVLTLLEVIFLLVKMATVCCRRCESNNPQVEHKRREYQTRGRMRKRKRNRSENYYD